MPHSTLPPFECSPEALCHDWPFLGGTGPFPPLLTHFVFFLVQSVAIPLAAPLSLYFTFLKILDFGDVLVHNKLKKLQSFIFCSLQVVYACNCWPRKNTLITHYYVDLGNYYDKLTMMSWRLWLLPPNPTCVTWVSLFFHSLIFSDHSSILAV